MKTNQQLLGPPLPFLSSKKCLIATTNLARLHDRASGRRAFCFVVLIILCAASCLFPVSFSNLVYFKESTCMPLKAIAVRSGISRTDKQVKDMYVV